MESQKFEILPEVAKTFQEMTAPWAPLGRKLKEFETRYLSGEVMDDNEPLSPFRSKHERKIYMHMLDQSATQKRHTSGIPPVLRRISADGADGFGNSPNL